MNRITKDFIAQQFKAKGLRLTPQRLAIIEVLIEKGDLHPGTRYVYEEAKKKKKSLSLSTAYAALNEFSRLGIIKTLQFDSMENRYEGSLEEHLNLVCERCGKIIDYEVPPVADQQEIAKKTGFSVTDTRLEYYGYCRDCHVKTKEGGDNSVEEEDS
ncbi:MAG: Fur family transcriptional regulator [Proteobacteria bacterium]|nr:Fur family transcriptional regulator [Pseudomonadota bacterium]